MRKKLVLGVVVPVAAGAVGWLVLVPGRSGAG